MLASIFIICCCTALLVYWLRYSCILLLRHSPKDATTAAPSGVQFSFGCIRKQIEDGVSATHPDEVLDRDARLLISLLKHASGLRIDPLEDRLLVSDFRVIRCWHRIARITLPNRGRSAVLQLARIMEVLAARMIDRAGLGYGTNAN